MYTKPVKFIEHKTQHTVECTFECTVPIDKDRHLANSSHETSIPRGSGVNTVHILQGFDFNYDFGIYLDHN